MKRLKTRVYTTTSYGFIALLVLFCITGCDTLPSDSLSSATDSGNELNRGSFIQDEKKLSGTVESSSSGGASFVSANDYTPTAVNAEPLPFNIVAQEIGLVFGTGLVIYYLDATNLEDKIFSSKEDIIERFTSFNAWKYDTNIYETNAVTHPFAGSLYYLAGRTNGYSQFPSFLIATGASIFWEYICEFQEIISINDMIYTPVGGYAIGESAYQFASLFADNSEDSWLHELIVNSTQSNKGRYYNSFNKNGRESNLWHDIYFYTGGASNDSGNYFMHAGFHGELLGIRKVKKRGEVNEFSFNSPSSTILGEISAGDAYLKSSYLYFSSSLGGYYLQNLKRGLHGYSFSATLDSAMEYDTYRIENFNDKVGSIHLLQPNFDLLLGFHGLYLNYRGKASGSLSMVKSYGIYNYYHGQFIPDDVANQGALTVAKQGYYFAYGVNTVNSLALGYKNFEAGIEGSYSFFWAIDADGMTNREEETGEDFPMRDERTRYGCWLTYDLYKQYSLSAKVERRSLYGYAEGSTRENDETLYKLSLMYRFR